MHRLGFGYADGTLQRGGHRLAVLLAAGGLAGAALLVFGTSAYPVLMVGVLVAAGALALGRGR